MKQVSITVPDGMRLVESKIGDTVTYKVVKEEKSKEEQMKEFLEPFLNNLELVRYEEYPNSVFYRQGGEIIFELQQDGKNRWLWVHYNKIWKVFYDRFGLRYQEISDFIKPIVEEAFKFGEVTPIGGLSYRGKEVEEAFKFGEVTPRSDF